MTDEKIFYQYWPENVPKHIDIPEVSLDHFLKDAAKKYPDSVATSYFNNELTYKQLDELADRIATALTNLGLVKGDVVALHFTNVPPAIAAYYGVLRMGGVTTMISPLFKALEIKYQLVDSEAKALIFWEGFDGIYENVDLRETPVKIAITSSLGNWFIPDPTQGELLSPDGSKMYLEDLIIKTKPDPVGVRLNVKKDLAALQYTGGTTGMPKGGMLSHHNMVANVEQIISIFPELDFGNEVFLTALPLYHIYAQNCIMNVAIRTGSKQVLVMNPREAEELIEAVEQHKITIFPGVAAMYNNINNHPGVENANMSSIKYCFSGAGPLPREVQEKFESLTGAKLREGYGLTEASPLTHINPLSGRFKNGTVGLPVPNTDMKIVDLETREKVLGINEIGELCIKGPQVFLGYYKKDSETKATLRDGWLFTGDAALVDEEGYTVIKERLKNMLKYKGHSVYPAEIEDLLFQHEAILDVAVIGVPDETAGETIKAFIVLKPEFKGKVNESDIIDWAKQNMAAYKYPRNIQFIDEIPKSRIGKTLHRILRDGKTELD